MNWNEYQKLGGGQHSVSWYQKVPKRRKGFLLLLLIAAASVLFLSVSLAVIISVAQSQSNTLIGTGVVVTDVKSCSEMGRNVLVKGGNAVDAAFVAILCMGLYSPQYNGVGGGGFMVVFQNATRMETIDFREIAPSAATEDMFKRENSSSTRGGLSVAVPGEMRGLEIAHTRYGK